MQFKKFSRLFVLFIALALAFGRQNFVPTPEISVALERISPASLRGNLSYLASDQLEGRDTPSHGLDLAAAYIAAQFRKAGIEPCGDDGYFQTARMLRSVTIPNGFEMSLQDGPRTMTAESARMTVLSRRPLELSQVKVYKIRERSDVAALKFSEVRGKVIAITASHEKLREAVRAAVALQPAAFLEVADKDEGSAPLRLIDPNRADVFQGTPRLVVWSGEVKKALRGAKAGETALTVSVKLPAPTLLPVIVRNVIGLIRGSDPALREQFILVTAHYDHLGVDSNGRVFPGANDDGSGTVSVIEIGKALASLPVHPKRSIVLMTFFGEEEGSLGSNYYAYHPVFPLEKTVADLNLEQVGRTDSSAGREVSNATLTGYEYSNISRALEQAGTLTGVKVYEAHDGDEFFNRSDNITFAEHGIPAHTIVVAFEYPDYHAVSDTWQKIDYDNMAKVDRMITLGSIILANDPAIPQWNRANAKAAQYVRGR